MTTTIFFVLKAACLAVIIFALVALYIELRSIKSVGYIVINTSDPEKDIYCLELNVPFGELDNYSKVMFRIRHE